MRVQVLAFLLVVAALLGGCAKAVTGAAHPVDGAVQAGPDPKGPEATWMNRFCGIGKLLITAAETNPVPVSSDDPAVLKRSFVEATGRLVGVLDAVLSDLKALRPAPAPDIDPKLDAIIDNLSESRSAIASAKASVEASEPMTSDVYSAAVDKFGTGLHGFESALKNMGELDFPDELKDAAEVAPNCA